VGLIGGQPLGARAAFIPTAAPTFGNLVNLDARTKRLTEESRELKTATKRSQVTWLLPIAPQIAVTWVGSGAIAGQTTDCVPGGTGHYTGKACRASRATAPFKLKQQAKTKLETYEELAP